MIVFLLALHLLAAVFWVGGMAFAFCGFMMLHFVHVNAVAVVAHLPWLLLAIDAYLRPQSRAPAVRRTLAGAAIALLLTMFLPWYSKTYTALVGGPTRSTLASAQTSLRKSWLWHRSSTTSTNSSQRLARQLG